MDATGGLVTTTRENTYQSAAADSEEVGRRPQLQRTNWAFDAQLTELKRQYSRTNEAVPVNFRELVPLTSGVDRATHLMHSYPAKLLPNIPIFFSNCLQLSNKDSLVVDPFCGTGTTMVEAVLSGRRAAGADANPLARMIARAKLSAVEPGAVIRGFEQVKRQRNSCNPAQFSAVMNVDSWFHTETKEQLGKLLGAIRTIPEPDVQEFLEVCLSSCIKRVSFADPRLSVPVRQKSRSECPDHNLVEMFEKATLANLRRLRVFQSIVGQRVRPSIIVDDARAVHELARTLGPADLIITSPPYVGAQKYIRSSSLSIGWLGLAPEGKLRRLEKLNIGREHYHKADYADSPGCDVPAAREALNYINSVNPLRAHIAANYLKEMTEALRSAHGLLRLGGNFVLVIGNNSICGRLFETSKYLRCIMEEIGFELECELIDDIRSRGLMTKRNKTAGLISQEHILLMRKVGANDDL